VRYRLMATYHGSPFEAGIGPTDADIVLFAACPPPEALGFEPATGHWRKQLRITDVQAVWESRPVGTFRGERCMVLDDLGDRLHIGYLGHDGYKAEQLGYWQVDRGVFELIAPRTEVSEILEERTELVRVSEHTGSMPVLRPAGPPDYRSSGSFGIPEAAASAPAAYRAVPDDTTGVAVPVTAEPPLPLEAEALRAATAARKPRQGRRVPPAAPVPAAPVPAAEVPPAPAPPSAPAATRPSVPDSGFGQPRDPRQVQAVHRPMATERPFADLAGLAGIPAASYAIGEEVEGALCLIPTGNGFEVFHSADGARHELQVFTTEESACFYLFGVLAAEAVRNGTLARMPAGRPA
jgi:hypothetical protein